MCYYRSGVPPPTADKAKMDSEVHTHTHTHTHTHSYNYILMTVYCTLRGRIKGTDCSLFFI